MATSEPDRSGFIVGTPQQFRWLRGIVQVVLVLNLLDAVLTLFWVSSGLAHEANPLLRDLVQRYPVPFMLVKLSLVSLGSWVLWTRRRRPLAVIAIFMAFLAYYWVLLHHLDFLGAVVSAMLSGWRL